RVRQSVIGNTSLRESIKAEVAERTLLHQVKVAALKSAQAARPQSLSAASGGAANPLVMLAHGDSWFDYPLVGNGPLLGDTDVIAQLQAMGSVNPLVLNVSHY